MRGFRGAVAARQAHALARTLGKSGTSRISASTGMGWVACADPAARRAESRLRSFLLHLIAYERNLGMRREFGWNSTLALVSGFENIPPEVLAHEATPPRWVANASVAVVLLGHSAVPLSIAIRTGARRGPPARPPPSVPAWLREKHGKSGVWVFNPSKCDEWDFASIWFKSGCATDIACTACRSVSAKQKTV